MKAKYFRPPRNQWEFVRILIGATLIAAATILVSRDLISTGECAIIVSSGFVIYLWGCATLAKAKGYTAGQGVILGIAFPPALLLFVFHDRTKMSKEDLEEEGRENAAEEGARKAARRRPLKGTKRGVAWLLGLFFLAVGLAMIAGYEVYWARVVAPERKALTMAISINSDKLDIQNDGKLIHVVGQLAGAENLTDPEFGVAVDALKLQRRVWMYQWEENGRKGGISSGTIDAQGNTKTDYKINIYNYEKVWSEKIINSRAFHNVGHDNPDRKNIADYSVNAAQITLGAFAVAPELVKQIDNFKTMPASPTNLAALAGPLQSQAKIEGSDIYFGTNFNQPSIGDLKIQFEAAPPAVVSVIAQQNGNRLSPYPTANAGSVVLLRVGTYSTPEMVAQFAKTNVQQRALVWVAGCVLILFGSLVIRIAIR